ncbi:MAG: NeuD/PglB/VioB family sugar acetyltransferase [Flammeovirgaceae bacterium]
MEDKAVIIFGATGLGKVALNIFQSRGMVAYCFLDDDKEMHNQEINDVLVMGHTQDDGFLKFIGKKCSAFVAIEDREQRLDIIEMLKTRRKVMPLNAIHDLAYVSENAYFGHGNLINVGAIVNPDAKITNHCLIHSQAVIEYEATLDEFAQIGAGAIIGPKAHIGEGALIGAGAVVATGIKIGAGAQVAPGAVVLQNVEAEAIVFGNPAKGS